MAGPVRVFQMDLEEHADGRLVLSVDFEDPDRIFIASEELGPFITIHDALRGVADAALRFAQGDRTEDIAAVLT